MKTLYALGVVLLLIFSIQTAHASAYPDGCTATTKYSSTTGHLCSIPTTCAPGDLFSSQTGQPCNSAVYLPGCTSTLGYSITTGSKCDGSNTVTQVLQNASPSPMVSSKQSQLNAINQQIANLNTKYTTDKIAIEAQPIPLEIQQGQETKLYNTYIDTYNTLMTQYQQIAAGN